MDAPECLPMDTWLEAAYAHSLTLDALKAMAPGQTLPVCVLDRNCCDLLVPAVALGPARPEDVLMAAVMCRAPEWEDSTLTTVDYGTPLKVHVDGYYPDAGERMYYPARGFWMKDENEEEVHQAAVVDQDSTVGWRGPCVPLSVVRTLPYVCREE